MSARNAYEANSDLDRKALQSRREIPRFTPCAERYRIVGSDVSVRNRCRRADGSVDAIDATATVVPGSAGACLK